MKKTLALLLSLFFFLAKPNCQVNLNNGLIAFYPFNGNADDASGNGLNGNVQNGAQLTTDRFGTANSAYQFDGINDVILVHDNGILSPPSFSIAYYFLSESAGHQICIGKINYTDGNGATYNSGLNVNNASNTWFNLSSPTSSCFLQIPGTEFYPSVASPAVSLNEWHCIVNTFENGNEKIYLDGVLVSNEILPFTTSKYCTNTDFLIGSWWSGDLRPFKGKLDEVRMYDRAINEDEVHALCDRITTNTEYIINDYTEVLGFDPCKNTLLVNDAVKFNIGDTVLLIQMKGAVIDSTNTASFGNIIDYKNAGNYEFNIIKQKNGNSLDLKNVLTRQYDILNGKVQLVRVPYFQNYTVPAGSILTCLPWDGSKGGITVVNVQNSLTLNGDIDVSGKGFSGGKVTNTGLLVTNCGQNQYNYPLGSVMAATKGESITLIGQGIASGKGAPANAGGGGLDHNSGGGGGSNGGNGGFGGYQLEECGNAPFDNRGIGAKKIDYPTLTNKILMGGGGGAGHCNNGVFNANGGNGGGIILIQASQIINPGTNEIRANGGAAVECNSTAIGGGCHDAGGGGGGGGSILINATTISNPLNFISKGGKGADLTFFDRPAGAGRIGPGGGGGAGIVSFNSATLPGNATVDISGGLNGTIPLDGNNPWGTTPGTDGITSFNLQIVVDNILFKSNIDSVRINNSQTNCSNFDFKALEYTNQTPVTNWQWQFGDGNNSNSPNVQHTYNTTGQFMIVLKGTDINGCSSTDTIKLAINPLFITKSNDTTVCKNAQVQLLVNGGITYSWQLQSTLSSISIPNPIATPTTTTTYYVNVKGADGCINSDSIKISVRPDPVFSISASDNICQNNSIQLTSDGGDVYLWQPSNSLNNPSASNPIATPLSNTTYNVQITDTVCGNSTSLSTTITVQPVPLIKASKSNDIDCSTGYSQLSATGGSQYQWTPAATLSSSSIPNPVATPVTPTQYLVKGTNNYGCSSYDSVLVDIKAINKGKFLMPSAFTPNNDGRNDCFGAKYWGYILDFDFKIFNRWGECVFSTKNPSQCWDGYYKDVPQKADVYVYIIKAKSFCEESVFRKGTVALIR